MCDRTVRGLLIPSRLSCRISVYSVLYIVRYIVCYYGFTQLEYPQIDSRGILTATYPTRHRALYTLLISHSS